MLIKGAKIWTLEGEGIIEKGDVLIDKGKIIEVGEEILVNGNDTRIVDGSSMHLTPGIIDEHSHIGLRSVNESGQNNSAEVRMTDAIRPNDINIYRQLLKNTNFIAEHTH